MKITVTLKDPDGFSDGIDDAVKADVAQMTGLDDDEREQLEESRREKANKALDRWVEYGEYVTLDFDLETLTATVRPRK